MIKPFTMHINDGASGITTEMKEYVWLVLETLAGAREVNKEHFMESWPECREFRFEGRLGMGGKIWHQNNLKHFVYVSTYDESITEEQAIICDAVNALFDAKFVRTYEAR